MPISQLYRIGNTWGSFSWTDGFKPELSQNTNFWEEARQSRASAEAVVNRLMRVGRWNEAEEVMDRYL